MSELPEIRRLQQFVAVAEELHFGRAAARLGMTQPPLSVQIRRLEDQIGVSLFDRDRRHVSLTPAGEVLLAEANQILIHVARAVRLTAAATGGDLGELRIGFVSTADYNVLPAVLRSFQADHPHVHLVLRELTTDEQLVQFAVDDLDVGFVVPPIDSDQLDTELLHSEPLVVALPVSHALATGSDALGVEQLAAERFIDFDRASAPQLHDALVSYCTSNGFRPNVTQVATQMQTIVSLVSADMGVALVPQSIQRLGRKGVAYRPLTPTSPPFRTAIAWPKQCHPTIRSFVDTALSLSGWPARDD